MSDITAESGYAVTAARLLDLKHKDRYYRDDPDAPSMQTVKRAHRFLSEVYVLLPDMPRGAPSCFEHDISIYWIDYTTKRTVSLTQLDRRMTAGVYWRDHATDARAYEHDATPEHLAERLKWFMEG